jgi:hypothetical protein
MLLCGGMAGFQEKYENKKGQWLLLGCYIDFLCDKDLSLM